MYNSNITKTYHFSNEETTYDIAYTTFSNNEDLMHVVTKICKLKGYKPSATKEFHCPTSGHTTTVVFFAFPSYDIIEEIRAFDEVLESKYNLEQAEKTLNTLLGE